MAAPSTSTISANDLNERLGSSAELRVLDVRTPAEFETAHIEGSVNVPLDVVREHRDDVAQRLESDVVLVCHSGQRATQADELLRGAGIDTGVVLEGGLSGWQKRGFEVTHGDARWELERQVRLVAGSIVLTSVLGSIGIPKLKWIAAGIGGGLTYAAVSNTCAMASLLSKLPYNRGAGYDARALVAQLGTSTGS